MPGALLPASDADVTDVEKTVHARGHGAPVEQCPVTAFLREKRLTGTKIARLHAEVHQAKADETLQRALTAWFLERMQMQEAGDD